LRRDFVIGLFISGRRLNDIFSPASAAVEPPLRFGDEFHSWGEEIFMNRLMIYALLAVAVLGTATTMLLSHSPSIARPVAPVSMMKLQEVYAAAGVNRLPNEDFEDQSLVYSMAAKR
jgi:hypothetical protein